MHRCYRVLLFTSLTMAACVEAPDTEPSGEAVALVDTLTVEIDESHSASEGGVAFYVGDMRWTEGDAICREGDKQCRGVRGDLTIDVSVSSTERLWCICAVEGDLTISDTSNLKSLQGLHKLVEVGGDLTVENIPLANLDDLSALRRVGGTMGLVDLPELQRARLPALASLGDLTILRAESLTTLDLPEVTSLEGPLHLEDNPRLANLSGLRTLERMNGRIELTRNPAMASLDGLNQLQIITGELVLKGNHGLTDFSALSDLTIITSDLHVENNNGMTRLDLPSLSAVGKEIYIGRNSGLRTLNGLRALRTVNGDITVEINQKLKDVSALGGLNTVRGDLILHDNGALDEDARAELLRIIGEENVRGDQTITAEAP